MVCTGVRKASVGLSEVNVWFSWFRPLGTSGSLTNCCRVRNVPSSFWFVGIDSGRNLTPAVSASVELVLFDTCSVAPSTSAVAGPIMRSTVKTPTGAIDTVPRPPSVEVELRTTGAWTVPTLKTLKPMPAPIDQGWSFSLAAAAPAASKVNANAIAFISSTPRKRGGSLPQPARGRAVTLARVPAYQKKEAR